MHTIKLSDVVQELLGKGFSSRQVRRELAGRGIKWNYRYERSGGLRERIRNLRWVGLKLCACGHSYPISVEESLCPDCLIEKWGGTR